jgi:sugar lactone lactonase YvrE
VERFIRSLVQSCTLTFVLFCFAAPVQSALSTEVQKGLSWLETQVQANGTLANEPASPATPLQNRAEALFTLKLLATIPASLTDTVLANGEDSTEYLARRAIAATMTGQNADAVIALLEARQNADGGFAGIPGHESAVLDTAMTLLAFKSAGYTSSTTITNALGFLDQSANPDGGFGLSAKNGSSLYVTSYALQALQAYSQSYALSQPIARARQWLLSMQQSGAYADTLDNAMAVLALADITPDAGSYSGAVSALAASQQADGSWHSDPYLTSLALRALFKASQGPAVPTAGQIAGTVIDAALQTGLGDVQIQLLEAPALTSVSSPDGKFTLDNVMPGTYTVQIGKAGYGMVNVGNVTVSAGSLYNLGTIALSPAANTATLSGRISDDTGAPVVGAAIVVTVNGTDTTATSNAAGDYQLTGLPLGSAAITVSKSGYDTATANVQLTAGALFTFSPSLYPANTTPTTVELRVRVLDTANYPIAGAKLTVGSQTAASDADGRLILTGLSAGVFSATLEASGFTNVTLNGALIAGINNIGDVHLAELATTSTLSGQVTDTASQKTIGGAVVLMQGSSIQSVTDTDGHYTLSGLSDTEVTLYVSAPGYFGRNVNATLSPAGHYRLDIALDKAVSTGISISSVTTNASDYEPYSEVEAVATLSSTTSQDVDITLRALVLDPTGNIVQEIQANPGLGAVNPPDLPITVPANGETAVPIDWQVLSALPGTYTLVVRASDLSGKILVENSAAVMVLAATRIGGGITLDPPIAQASGEQPVHITADIVNAGNQTIKAGTVQVAVTLENPDTSGPAVQKTSLKTFLEGAPLSEPHGGAFDAAGNLYVANASERKIMKIAPDGQAAVFAAISTTTSPGKLQALAFDKAGNLLVLSSQNRIVKIAPDETQTVINTGLNAQYGFDVDDAGNIYVTGDNADGRALLRIDSFGNPSVLVANGLKTPNGAVFDKTGTLYVTNYGDNSIVKIAAGGKISPFVTGLNRPQGITTDTLGNFYVANSGANNVLKITPTGEVSEYASGFANPYELRFDASGNLFVTNSGDHTVAKVDSSRTVSLFAKGIANKPQGMAYDAAGNLYIGNAADNTVTRLDASDNVSVIGTGFNNPRGLAVSGSGDVFVANYSAGSISKISGGIKSTLVSGLKNPYGVALDSANNLYVSENQANRISRIDTDSGQKQVFAETLLNSPVRIRTDAAGDQYLLNKKFIARLDGANGGSIVAAGLSNAIDFAIAPDGGFYVIDGNTSLKEIDADGVLTATTAITSSSGGIAVDAAGNIYLTENSNKRIIRIAPDASSSVFANLPGYPRELVPDGNGGFFARLSSSAIVKVDASGATTGFISVSGATGMAVDAAGKLYVSAGSSNSVKVFDTSGNLLNTITGPQNPSGIALTASGQLLVVEATSLRVSTYNEQGAFETSVYGFSKPKDLTWTGSELIFSDSNNRVFSLVSGQAPRLVGSASADYLAWHNGALYLSSGDKLSTMAVDGAVSTFYANTGSTSLSGIAVRPDGAISIASRDDGRVMTLDAGARVIANYPGLRSPQGLMIDSGGNVYVSNPGLNNVLRISPDGKQSEIFSTGTKFRNLVSDSFGQIYATGGNSVYRLSSTGTSSKVASGGSTTNGIALLGEDIYVTDGGASAVRVVNGTQLDTYASGLGSGYGVRVGPDGGVYVAVESNGTVMRYADEKLALYAAGLSSPRSLVFDTTGHLYAGGKSGVITHIDGSGQNTDLSVSASLTGKTIDGLAVDASNTLHAIIGAKNAVYKIIMPPAPADTPPGTVVYTATADVPELAVDGAAIPLDFGHWTPAFGGDFSVRITPLQSAVDGALANSIHVGPHAYGTITADKSELVPGQNTVALQVNIKGADFTSLAKVDTANLKEAFSTGGIFPKAMPVDRSGNAYLPVSGGIKRIAPDGQMSDFIVLPGIAGGTAMAIDAKENLYVYTSKSKELVRIAQDGAYESFASLAAAPLSMAVDSRDNVLVLTSNGVLRFAQNGSREFLGNAAVTRAYALTIDGHDNIYVQNKSNIITKIAPDGSVSTLLAPDPVTGQPNFEYEGINIAGDCADNVFLTPLNWKEVGQSGEEHVLVHMIGKTGLASPILDGKTVKPAITDMDFVSYDRFSGNLFIWTDKGYKVYKLPVTCGAIGVDLHIVLAPGQSASGFNIAPTSQIVQPDGSIDYVWNLKDVTAFGQDVRFDTLLDGVALGDMRPMAKDAFLLFKNTFVPGDIRVPLEIPKLAANNLVALAVATGKPEYPALTNVDITTDLINPNNTAVHGLLKLDILDAQGVLVKTVLAQDTVIHPDVPVSVSPMPAFNTGDTIAGTYTVHAVLENAESTVLAQASTSFRIVAGNDGDPALDASVSVDRLEYNPFDSVNISARVRNLASNLLFDNLTVQETVKDADGNSVYTGSQQIPQLLGGALRDLTFIYSQNNAAPGVYTLEQTVSDAMGTVLSSKTTSFTVSSTGLTGSGLKGQVSIASEEVLAGSNVMISAKVQNLGNADVAALPLTLSIVDPATETVLAAWPYSADIIQGDSFNTAVSWTAAATGKTNYVIVLTATPGGKTLPLAQSSFTVVDAMKLDVKQQLLSQNRVLVLLSCQYGDGSDHEHKDGKARHDEHDRKHDKKHHDDHGHEEGKGRHNHHNHHDHHDHHDHGNCIDDRSAFIDGLLTQLNLPHLITVTAEDFRTAFRSGHYNTFWLSGGIDKLHDPLAEEIREAVNRGDSLLIDGMHDERNKLLDEVVGVQYRGKLAPANQPVEFTGPLFAADPVVARGRPLKLELGDGTLQARFPDHLDCDDCDNRKHHGPATVNPAIVSHRYGQGRGMIMGFDLVDTLMQEPSLSDVWRAIIETTFDELLPELPDTYTSGALVVARTTVANLGHAVGLQVIDTLPADARVITTEPAAPIDSTGTQATWDFSLGIEQSQDLTLSWWLSGLTGSYTLDTLVSTTQGGQAIPYGNYPLTLTVASALDQMVTDELIARLKALTFSSNKDRQARNKALKSLQEALAHTSSGDYDGAIDSLIDAVNRLNAIKSQDTRAYRLGLDRWLQGLEQQWRPTPAPHKPH